MSRRPAPGRVDPLADFRDHCKSCGDGILWTVTRTGDRMPINETPSYFGNITIYIEPARGKYRARLIATVLRPGQVDGARQADNTLYRSHFADYPDAKRYRRKDRRNRA